MSVEIESDSSPSDNLETYSGVVFDVLTPAGEVRIDDIAHGLAHICRFGGQCERHYSVAEHSVLVHNLISRYYGCGPEAFAGLLHDAEEAYLGDMVRPLKQHNTFFAEVSHRLQAYIRDSLGVAWSDDIARVVKLYDNVALRAEAAQLMHSKGKDWQWDGVPELEGEIDIFGYSQKLAKNVFLETYRIYQPQ